MKNAKATKRVAGYMSAVRDEITKQGKMRHVDAVALDMLESFLTKWVMADEEVKNLGILLESDRGNYSKNPAIDVANASLRQAMSIMQDYGLTALSEKKLKRGEVTEADDSPLTAFLNE